MKVDFDHKILDLKGNAIKDGDTDLTLAGVVAPAMLAVLQSDANLTGAEKVRMFRIAQRATDGGEQELSVEDVALIKDRVVKGFGALVVGRVYDLLEGNA